MSPEANTSKEDYPFDPVVCIEATRGSFAYSSVGAGRYWPGLPAMYVERRFLPDEVQVDGGYNYSLSSVTQAMPATLSVVPSTKEDLQLLVETTDGSLRTLGSTVEADARAAEQPDDSLFSNLSLAKIAEHLGRHIPSQELDFLNKLKAEGHFVLPGDETLPTTLIPSPGDDWPWPDLSYNDSPSPDPNITFPVINLDKLDELRPGLVGQRLIEWNTAFMQHNFALRALQNLLFHERPMDTYVPAFLLGLSQIADEKQRQIELKQCHTLLGRLATIANTGGDFLQHYSWLHYRFHESSGPLGRGTDEQGKIHFGDAVKHLGSCRGSNPQQRRRASTLSKMRERFLYHPAPQQRLSKADRPVVTDPAYYLLWGKDNEIMDAFLQKHNLSLDDFAPLKEEPNHRGRPPAYNLLANLIILSRQGRANAFSEIQRALVEDLYRVKPIHARILGDLASVWARLDATRPGPSNA